MSFRLVPAALPVLLAALVLGAPAAIAQGTQPGAAPSTVPNPMQQPAAPAKRSRTPSTAKEPTPGQSAARERQRQCGAEWKQAKAAGKVAAGMKWPQYWSQCNTRLKQQKA